MLSYDPVVKRSDPNGLLVRFEVEADLPVVRFEMDLNGDGEPAIPLAFGVALGFDGRYVRALAFKPTVNGTWPLVLKAWNQKNEMSTTTCSPGVQVVF